MTVMAPKSRRPSVADSMVQKRPELTRRERRKLEVRRRIVDAARDLFRTRGFSATRVTEICERADVAEKTFFNHFPTKQGVLGDLATSAVGELLLSIEDARKKGRTTSERLEIFFHTLADTMAAAGPPQKELVAEIVQVVHASGDTSTDARNLHDAVGALVADGLEAGDVTTRHDPETLTEMIIGAYYVLTFNFVNLEGFAVRQQAESVARFLADAFQPRAKEETH
jgi:AcrR family transcriptional regulator